MRFPWFNYTVGTCVSFESRSIAVIGAFRNTGKFGHVQLRNLAELGFQGEAYPVNPNVDRPLGLKARKITVGKGA